MAILQETQSVGSYKVQSLIKSNLYTETYRVEDSDTTPYFLKLFVMKRLPPKLLNQKTGVVNEIEYCQKLNHKGIVSYIASGTIESEESNCQYYVTNYMSGELLAQRIQTGGTIPESEATAIFRGILEALKYLHSQIPTLCHNDLDPTNIILSGTTGGEPEIIDIGHLSERCAGSPKFDLSDLDPFYHADETRVGIFDEQGDIFSACTVFYAMLSGHVPWETELPEDGDYKERMNILAQYRKKVKLDLDSISASDKVKQILSAGLKLKSGDRTDSVEDLLQMLDNDTPEKEAPHTDSGNTPSFGATKQPSSPNYVEFQIKKGTGNGFEDIAGMKELKDTLNKQVIFVIKNGEVAKEYKITPPNGMLLYGPPGCGKSFFAEKFAEETGFNYLFVKSSDLASSYVHGSQEKINQLFDQAAKSAPIVICFDEFDALVPDRSWNNVSAEEVNEFLTQMNNCAKRGIFIVATSNRPDKIDPAVLRTGRIDKMVYVPLPDFDARREMFGIYLNGRPQEEGIDLDELARLTEGYIASDIAYIVNDAAMVAAYTRTKITAEILLNSIHNTHPSIRLDTMEVYENIRRKMESEERRGLTESKIGFKITP